jgi:dATP pyrophosphohydrolase
MCREEADDDLEGKADSQNSLTFYQTPCTTPAHHSPYNHVMNTVKTYKVPRSTLVIIHTAKLEVLLIERADRPGYWQSVTGSQEGDESLLATAAREVMEETGIDATQAGACLVDWQQENIYEIYPMWRHRFAPDVTHNTEHVFGLQIPERVDVTLSALEHLQYVWLPYKEAAAMCFSPTNREAILDLPRRTATSVTELQASND